MEDASPRQFRALAMTLVGAYLLVLPSLLGDGEIPAYRVTAQPASAEATWGHTPDPTAVDRGLVTPSWPEVLWELARLHEEGRATLEPDQVAELRTLIRERLLDLEAARTEAERTAARERCRDLDRHLARLAGPDLVQQVLERRGGAPPGGTLDRSSVPVLQAADDVLRGWAPP